MFREHWKIISKLARDFVKELEDLPENAGEDLINEFCLRVLADGDIKGSHCGKKYSIQRMGDAFSMPQVSHIKRVYMLYFICIRHVFVTYINAILLILSAYIIHIQNKN